MIRSLAAALGLALIVLSRPALAEPEIGSFADGFETGDLSAWSNAATKEGSLVASPLARLSGQYGALFDVGDLPEVGRAAVWLHDTTPRAEERYTAGWSLDLNDLALPSEPRAVRLVDGRMKQDVPAFEVRLIRSQGAWTAVGIVRDDADVAWRTDQVPVPSGWARFGIEWRRATGPGASDGSFELTVDDVSQSVTGVDNDLSRVDGIEIGLLGGIGRSSTGTVFLDDFVSEWGPRITPTPAPTVTPTPAVEDAIVSMGDSYVAGTAGRWRGNTNGYTNVPRNLAAFRRTDTGSNAYDNYGAVFPGDQCFRARSAVIHLGDPWIGVNVACSNARTNSRTSDEEGRFKPGIDAEGQLAYLADVLFERRVRMIAVSIGANDFRFGPVLKACAKAFLTSSSLFPKLCSKDADVLAFTSPASVAKVRSSIAEAFAGIVRTMRQAGYADADWTLVSHDYPRPLPPSSAIRYGQSGYTRQSSGGCPFYDADLDWLGGYIATVNATVAAAVADAKAATGKDIVTLDMSGLFEGRRLCEKGTKLAEETANDAELVRFGERVDMVRLSSQLPGSPYELSEGVHPNNLGQRAMRACLRRAFGGGNARSGTCKPPADWGLVDANDEPAVVFEVK